MQVTWLPQLPVAILALLAGVALLAGLARGFSGFGAALIFVPVAGALVGPRLAAPILAIVDLVFAAYLLPAAWRIANRREVGWMFVGALAGIPAGVAVLLSFEPLTLRWLIAGMAAAMLALLLSGWRYHGRPHASATVAVGAVSGLFSGVAQIGGPPVVSYWLGIDTEIARLRANVIVFFFLSGTLASFTYLWGGLVGGEVLRIALVVGPVYGLGTALGTRMFGFASPTVYRATALGLIALSILLSLPWSR